MPASTMDDGGAQRAVRPVLRIPQSTVRQGIRDISYDEEAGNFLILLGRSLSQGDEPFQLCAWNGSSDHVTLV